MTIISMAKLSILSGHIPNFELVPYDSARYRNHPTEVKWEGRKIAGLSFSTLALVASEHSDSMGKYISLSMAVPVNQSLSKVA